MATLHNSAPLLLSLFLPDTQLLLCIWITFLCYGILVVFPNPPSPPSPVAGFLRRGVLGESCKHICSLAAAFQEGPVRGSGPREPGPAGQWRLEGRVRGPWQLRPVVGMLTAAGRAEPQGRGCCQRPGATARQLPGPTGCGCWLSAQLCVRQAWCEREARSLQKHPGLPSPLLSASLTGWGSCV